MAIAEGRRPRKGAEQPPRSAAQGQLLGFQLLLHEKFHLLKAKTPSAFGNLLDSHAIENAKQEKN